MDWSRRGARSGLLVFRGLGSEHVLNFRNFQDGGKGLVFLQIRDERRVTIVLGLAQVQNAALEVAGLRKRLGEEKREAPAVGHGAILEKRAGPRTVVLEELGIFGECSAKCSNRF